MRVCSAREIITLLALSTHSSPSRRALDLRLRHVGAAVGLGRGDAEEADRSRRPRPGRYLFRCSSLPSRTSVPQIDICALIVVASPPARQISSTTTLADLGADVRAAPFFGDHRAEPARLADRGEEPRRGRRARRRASASTRGRTCARVARRCLRTSSRSSASSVIVPRIIGLSSGVRGPIDARDTTKTKRPACSRLGVAVDEGVDGEVVACPPGRSVDRGSRPRARRQRSPLQQVEVDVGLRCRGSARAATICAGSSSVIR